MMPIFLWLVSGLPATIYGYNETSCGDTHKPVTCSKGSITASGVKFDPSKPQAAIAIPKKYRIREQIICLKAENGKKAYIHLVDKMNPRFVGNRSFDLTPAALIALGIKPHAAWSGKIYLC